MHKSIPLLLFLALLLAACSSAGEQVAVLSADQEDAELESASDPAAETTETAEQDATDSALMQDVEAAEDAGTPAPGTFNGQPLSTLEDGSTCGFGDELEADSIVVDQIPGDGRDPSIASALSDQDNDDFPEPLVDTSRIISGGPPPDGIPPINEPKFQTASTVDWLRCNEPVLSLSIDGDARAYPVQVMTWHELVNDTFDDLPVTVSFCPLCNSALAYNRDLGDRVVTFGTSGRLFNSSLVMYDRETESLWTHFNGAAVVGELAGVELELLPMQTLSWASFLQQNPDGLVLNRDTGFDRSYGSNPYSGYDNVETDPILFDQEADPRLPAKERVVGIRRADDNAAIVLSGLAEAGVLETVVGGDTLTLWHLQGTSSALETSRIADGRDIGSVGVFLPAADGQALTFSRSADGSFEDAETGSTWNIQGIATAGALQGEMLEQVEHLDTFWFAVAAFEPDTRIVAR